MERDAELLMREDDEWLSVLLAFGVDGSDGSDGSSGSYSGPSWMEGTCTAAGVELLLLFHVQASASLNFTSLLMITLPLMGLYNLYALD